MHILIFCPQAPQLRRRLSRQVVQSPRLELKAWGRERPRGSGTLASCRDPVGRLDRHLYECFTSTAQRSAAPSDMVHLMSDCIRPLLDSCQCNDMTPTTHSNTHTHVHVRAGVDTEPPAADTGSIRAAVDRIAEQGEGRGITGVCVCVCVCACMRARARAAYSVPAQCTRLM